LKPYRDWCAGRASGVMCLTIGHSREGREGLFSSLVFPFLSPPYYVAVATAYIDLPSRTPPRLQDAANIQPLPVSAHASQAWPHNTLRRLSNRAEHGQIKYITRNPIGGLSYFYRPSRSGETSGTSHQMSYRPHYNTTVSA
jgi:hypothetical protein